MDFCWLVLVSSDFGLVKMVNEHRCAELVSQQSLAGEAGYVDYYVGFQQGEKRIQLKQGTYFEE